MKEIIRLKEEIYVSTRIPHGATMSLGELFSMVEGQVKNAFFHKIISEIKFGKRYTFTIDVIDVDENDYYGTIKERFEFKMFELE